MKKSLLSMGMLCIALTLTNCQKEQTETIEPAAEPNFELFAKPTDTKTTNEGLNTKWAAEDAINIFHAEADKTSYVNDGQFTLKDAESGKFEGTIARTLTDGTSYDWYAFYPYTSLIVTPANTNKGWVTVGGTAQTQTGNDSRAHLAGEACPLYGISKSVAKNEVPSIRMENLASVIKVNVTNNSGEDLTVSSVAFTGTEDIVGTYYINFAASPVTYKSSGDNYVSATATLSVKDGGVIANGSSAAFYIAIKPFTAKSGSTLKLAVNGYEKAITLKSDVTFTAGHIKTLGFDYDKKIEAVEYAAIDDASKLIDNSRVCIVAKNGNKYYYLPASPSLDAGKINGKEIEVVDNKINTKLDDASWTAKASGEQWSFFDGSNYLYHSNGGASGTDLAIGSTAAYQWNITSYSVANKTFKVAAYNNGTKTRGLLLNSNKFGGYALSNINAKGYSAIMLFVRTSDIPADKPIISSSDAADVSARGVENQTLAYSISNGVEGAALTAVGDGTVVTATCENDAVTYAVAANTTASDREGTITLTYSKDGATLAEKVVKVQQLAPVFKVSRTAVELEAAEGSQTTITVTSDFDWVADASASAGFTFTPNTYEWKESGKETVTITASVGNASESGTATLGTITFSNYETGEEITVTVTQKSSYVAPTTDTEVAYGLDAFSGGTSGSGSALTITNSDSNIDLSGVGYKSSDHVKIYANNTLTVAPQNGKTITKIVITAKSNYIKTWKTSTGAVSVSGSTATWTGTSTTSVTLTNTASGQARITKVVVTYK